MSIALVTGAGTRLGQAMAIALASEGYDLYLHAHEHKVGLLETVKRAQKLGRHVQYSVADFSNEQSQDIFIDEIKSRLPSLDLIVHNAGIFEEIAFENISRSDYRRMLAINLEAPFFVTQGLLPLLKQAQDPLVVHLADSMFERPWIRHSHYGLSKAGLATLTRSLANELAPRIRVNAIAPGAILFPESYAKEKRNRIINRVPLQRMGSPDDIVKALLFLAKDAKYMTGQIIHVDGGRNIVP